MKIVFRIFIAVLMFGLAGCATPNMHRNNTLSATDSEGVVIFTVSQRWYFSLYDEHANLSLSFFRISALEAGSDRGDTDEYSGELHMSRGRGLELPRQDEELDNVTHLRVLKLPPGLYLMGRSSSQFSHQVALGTRTTYLNSIGHSGYTFEVESGKAIYLGNLLYKFKYEGEGSIELADEFHRDIDFFSEIYTGFDVSEIEVKPFRLAMSKSFDPTLQ